jgi:hypothetical protein
MRILRIISLTASAAFVILSGCSKGIIPVAATNPSPVVGTDASNITGNWQVSSTAASAGKLSVLTGELTGSPTSITGVLHANSAAECVTPTTSIPLKGTADPNRLVTLSGELAGGVYTLSGTLASDGRSLTGATYTVTGGSCAFASAAEAVAQSYSPVTGTYVGTFVDLNGGVTAITASLSQSTTSDVDGNFSLGGHSILPGNVCFPSPIVISQAQVTGGSFTLTYTDPAINDTVTLNGSFDPDAQTLTVAKWALSGVCGSVTGTGSLSRQ